MLTQTNGKRASALSDISGNQQMQWGGREQKKTIAYFSTQKSTFSSYGPVTAYQYPSLAWRTNNLMIFFFF